MSLISEIEALQKKEAVIKEKQKAFLYDEGEFRKEVAVFLKKHGLPEQFSFLDGVSVLLKAKET